MAIYKSKYTGKQVEECLDKIVNGDISAGNYSILPIHGLNYNGTNVNARSDNRLYIYDLNLVNSQAYSKQTNYSTGGHVSYIKDGTGSYRKAEIFLNKNVDDLYLQLYSPIQAGDKAVADSGGSTVTRSGSITFIGDKGGQASIYFGTIMSSAATRLLKLKLQKHRGLWDMIYAGPVQAKNKSDTVNLHTPFSAFGFGSLQVNSDQGKSYPNELGPDEKIAKIEIYVQLPVDESRNRTNPEMYVVLMGA